MKLLFSNEEMWWDYSDKPVYIVIYLIIFWSKDSIFLKILAS